VLSITKIHAAQGRKSAKGYGAYLDTQTDDHTNAFEEYARAKGLGGPSPFWVGKAAIDLGLTGTAEPNAVDALCQGYDPSTGKPLVKGAGTAHVVGVDMTFSAPKDVSIVFAAGTDAQRFAITQAVQESVQAAIGYAESIAVTRHGKGGLVKQLCAGVCASVYTHFASRALDPQLHAHALLFNVARRSGIAKGDPQAWSALEHKAQFENKMATGILFRVELAHKLRTIGYAVEPKDQYFEIAGVTDEHRIAFSQRTTQIQEALKAQSLDPSMLEASQKALIAGATRAAKKEPAYGALMEHFREQAQAHGISLQAAPSGVLHVQDAKAPLPIEQTRNPISPPESFTVDHQELIDELLEGSSVISKSDALRAICGKAMGIWSAKLCLEELERFCASPLLVTLGSTATLTPVFTSKARYAMESDISRFVQEGASDISHRVDEKHVTSAFAQLEHELTQKVGTHVSLHEQCQAALHICAGTGCHAFVEGWAGTGKTTMLKAVASIYKKHGFDLVGTSLSAAAAQNLQQETGIASGTIASLLLSLDSGTVKLTEKSIVLLDEAGMVGSVQFAALQKAVLDAGAKLVAVGDPKQLQPIEAGGIFKALMERHGAAQITKIQRQRTDFEPLLDYLEKRVNSKSQPIEGVDKSTVQALRLLPEEARRQVLDELAKRSPLVEKALFRWTRRFDHQWMRQAVQDLAVGNAKDALNKMDANGCVHLISDAIGSAQQLVADWSSSKAAVPEKAIIAGTRQEVKALNMMARERLISDGLLPKADQSISIGVTLADEVQEERSVCVGERIVFLKNDKTLGVANGQTATVVGLRTDKEDCPVLVVQVDGVAAQGGGKKVVHVPTAQYNHLDHAYCLTNHKSQGRTYEQAFVLVNPLLVDRQWSYVACSRSRFQTSLYVNASALAVLDDTHQKNEDPKPLDKSALLELLAKRMSISHAKGTSLDYEAKKKTGKQIEDTSTSRSTGSGENRTVDIREAVQTLQSKWTDASRVVLQAVTILVKRRPAKPEKSIEASPQKRLDQELTP
jgi:conjugative relaxase-like TrwC/TraI family protein